MAGSGATRLVAGELTLPEAGGPLPVLPRVFETPHVHEGSRRGLVVGLERAVLLDPAAADAQTLDLPSALPLAIAYDPRVDRWAIGYNDGLTIVDGADASKTGVALGSSTTRSLARVGDEGWSLGSVLERVLDDGTVIRTSVTTDRVGCLGAAEGGAWVALPASTGGYDIQATDAVGEVLAPPRAHWTVATAERGCSFRMLGSAPYLCAHVS